MKYLFLTAFVFSVILSSAQYSNFDLSKYHLPEMKRQSLDFNFNGKAENRVWKTLNNEHVDEMARDKVNISDYRSNINYFLYLNSPKNQTNLSFVLSGHFNKESQSNRLPEQAERKFHEKEKFTSANLNFNKKQFSKKNWFLMAESDSRLSYNSDRSDRTKIEDKTRSANLSLGIGGGKGRIEQVQDFRQAILMIDELETRGVLNRGVTEQEMYELASLLSELKNERFFDSRLRKEADLRAIDSFLSAKGLVGEKNISYYYGMEDMWTYGDLQVRESGNQFRALCIPSYSFQNRKIDSIDRKTENVSLLYNLEYESRKPLSVKWQRNYNIGIVHNYTNVLESPQNVNVHKTYHTQVYMKGDLGFYPNTRTFLMGHLNVNYNNSSFNEFGEDSQNSFSTSAILACYYYISPRVRLNFSGSLNHRLVRYPSENISNSSYFHILYNAAFSYALF